MQDTAENFFLSTLVRDWVSTETREKGSIRNPLHFLHRVSGSEHHTSAFLLDFVPIGCLADFAMLVHDAEKNGTSSRIRFVDFLHEDVARHSLRILESVNDASGSHSGSVNPHNRSIVPEELSGFLECVGFRRSRLANH